jgi:hypothetical protein
LIAQSIDLQMIRTNAWVSSVGFGPLAKRASLVRRSQDDVDVLHIRKDRRQSGSIEARGEESQFVSVYCYPILDKGVVSRNATVQNERHSRSQAVKQSSSQAVKQSSSQAVSVIQAVTNLPAIDCHVLCGFIRKRFDMRMSVWKRTNQRGSVN